MLSHATGVSSLLKLIFKQALSIKFDACQKRGGRHATNTCFIFYFVMLFFCCYDLQPEKSKQRLKLNPG